MIHYDRRTSLRDRVLSHRLGALIARGEVNAAENFPFSELDRGDDPEFPAVAVDFYGAWAAPDNPTLSRVSFLRAEIAQGLQNAREHADPPSGQCRAVSVRRPQQTRKG